MAVTGDAAPQTTRARRIGLRPLVAAGLAAAVVAPVVVAVVAAWGRPWVPSGDWAMLALGTADTFTADTRWVGPYSREGWSHPGPLLFWLGAVPWRLAGGATWTLMVLAATVNAVSVAGTLWLAWRRGALALLAIVAVAVAWMLASVETGMAADPWNAWVTVLPTALFVMAVAQMVDGDRVGLPIAVVSGSFIAHSHIAYVPLVVVAGGVAVGWALWRRVLPWRWLVVAGLVPAALLWLAPVGEQLVGNGNLGAIVAGFGSDADQPAGIARAADTVARQLAWGGPWMGGDEPQSPSDGAIEGGPLSGLVAAVAVFGAAAGAARWRRQWSALRLQAMVAVVVAVGFVAVSRITGPVFDYLIRWWWPLAALWWASAGWSLWRAGADLVAERLGASSSGTSRRVATIATAVLVVAAAVVVLPTSWRTATAVADYGNPGSDLEEGVIAGREAVTEALAGRDRDATEVEVHAAGDRAGWFADAIGVQLVLDGWDVAVSANPVSEAKWGTRRVVDDAGLVHVAGRDPTAAPQRAAVWVVRPGSPAAVPPGAIEVYADPDAPGGALRIFVVP